MTTEILDYAANIKYLGFTFSSDKKDDSDMLRQMRVFYTKANRLLRLFHCCSTDVKLALFRSYCACFYCPFLWTHYKKSTHSKLRVAFNPIWSGVKYLRYGPGGGGGGRISPRLNALNYHLKLQLFAMTLYR